MRSIAIYFCVGLFCQICWLGFQTSWSLEEPIKTFPERLVTNYKPWPAKMSSGITSVEVTAETPGENQVIEVSYDGQEIIQPPLTFTENFTKQATKIDFESVMDEASSQAYVHHIFGGNSCYYNTLPNPVYFNHLHFFRPQSKCSVSTRKIWTERVFYRHEFDTKVGNIWAV